jgi:predicted ATP-grasp superfamily ATP-dependent carboligase
VAEVIDPNARRVPDECLLKPVASGGGRGVRQWHRGAPVPQGWYLQRRIEGTPGSIVFLASRGRATPLGVSRQLIGDPAFGATGYRYCGNILAADADAAFGSDSTLISRAAELASVASAEFELVGINGIDFMARDGVPIPVEINPRWAASVELAERAFSRYLFGDHVEACASTSLPAARTVVAPRGTTTGKAIVFARADAVTGDTASWRRDPDVRDVPRPGMHIRAGEPICTVFARADTAAECHAALVERASRIYAALKA